MSANKLRIGVAGVGHFGRYHALKVMASERAVLAGVFDPDAERAKTVGWEAGAPDMDFASLLGASDALVIAAPAEVHHALGVAALRAGKHVLMEKPIAATLAQADELAAFAQRNESLCFRSATSNASPPHSAPWMDDWAPRSTSRPPASRHSSSAAPTYRWYST